MKSNVIKIVTGRKQNPTTMSTPPMVSTIADEKPQKPGKKFIPMWPVALPSFSHCSMPPASFGHPCRTIIVPMPARKKTSPRSRYWESQLRIMDRVISRRDSVKRACETIVCRLHIDICPDLLTVMAPLILGEQNGTAAKCHLFRSG